MIQKELYLNIAVYFAFIVCYFILIIVFNDPESTERRIIINIIACLPGYVWIYIATKWCVIKYNKQLPQELSEMMDRSNVSASGQCHKTTSRLSLEQILATEDGFDIFANHLVKEFSIENLFFIFEMMQIKNDVLENELCIHICYI